MLNLKCLELVLKFLLRTFHHRITPIILLILFFGGCQSLSNAQSINRVSIADRSDGLGHVIRFHANARPDSFKIVQSSPEFIQVILYGKELKFNAETNVSKRPVNTIQVHSILNGFGVDISLAENSRFISRMYRDQNGRDVLIGLTRASANEVNAFTQGFSPLNWADFQHNNQAENNRPITEEPLPPPVPRSTIKFDTVIIDAGHGGKDPGGIGSRGTYEKNVVLPVALKLGAYIKEHLPDLKVVYTRDNDTFIKLDERGRIANRNQGDLFISIHTNAHHLKQPHGSEFFFLGMNRSQAALEVSKRENSVIQFEENGNSQELTEDQLLIYELSNSGYMASSRKFAELIDYQFKERAKRRSRGVKQAGLQVLWEASMPGVLVELGFLSNPAEERFLTSDKGQAIVASAIFRAVREYKEWTERSNANHNSER